MSGVMGGAHVDDEEGLLDNPQPAKAGGAKGGKKGSSQPAPRESEYEGDEGDEPEKKPSSNNQDLWLLNLFFKGCAVVW